MMKKFIIFCLLMTANIAMAEMLGLEKVGDWKVNVGSKAGDGGFYARAELPSVERANGDYTSSIAHACTRPMSFMMFEYVVKNPATDGKKVCKNGACAFTQEVSLKPLGYPNFEERINIKSMEGSGASVLYLNLYNIGKTKKEKEMNAKIFANAKSLQIVFEGANGNYVTRNFNTNKMIDALKSCHGFMKKFNIKNATMY